MSERRTEGPRRVVLPSGKHIGPGFQHIQTVRDVTIERYFYGEIIETIVEQEVEVHGVQIPMPDRGFTGTVWLFDQAFKIVRDDDEDFWGIGGKEGFLGWIRFKNQEAIEAGADQGWWDIGPDGDPQQLAIKISISDMVAENKTLMAHLMVDLGFFPSVGQARKNGWDKPLELGRHELGPKKKRAFVEIIP